MKQIKILVITLFFTLIGTAQDLIITEIMYNPSGTDTNWEWVEIYNSSTATINLNGYVFDDSAATPLAEANITNGSIDAQSSAVFFNGKNISIEQFKEVWGDVNAIAVSVWPTLGNGGDSIGIWDSFESYQGDNQQQTNAIEQLTYDNTDNGWPNDDGKASVFLTDLEADNSIGSNWSLSIAGLDTPLNTVYVSMPLHGNSGVDVGSPGNGMNIDDTESPLITCPEDVMMMSDVDNCGATFPPELPTATDNSDGIIVFEGVRSDNLDLIFPFPVGETIITWVAIDEAGNVSEPCTQRILINDDVAPEIICADNIATITEDGNAILVEVIPPQASNVCEGELTVRGERNDQLAIDAPYPIGVTTILWQAIDAANNTAECGQTITVDFNPSDENAITAFSIANQIGETNIDLANQTISLTMPFGTDTSRLIPMFSISDDATVSPSSGVIQDFSDPFVYTVTAQDGSFEQWTVVVVVEDDNTDPTIECPSNIVVQNDVDACGAIVEFEIVFSDNQSEATLETSHESGSLFPIGITEVLATVTDTRGNTSSCKFLVTVEDATPPILVCKDLTIQLDANDTATVAIENLIESNTDNCEVTEIEASKLQFAIEDIGENQVTLTATDNSGNETSCNALVTVLPFEEVPLLIVQSFTLINADTNEDLFDIESGMRIDINQLPTMRLDIRANTSDAVESVRLAISGALNSSRTESLIPYALFQDLPIGDYMGANFVVGSYEVTATPYAIDVLRGEMGEAFSLNFELFDPCENFRIQPELISEIQTCDGANGAITVTVVNGVEPIHYSWSHDVSLDSDTATGLGQGEYIITATDANNCSAELILNLKNPELPEVNLLPFEAIFDTDEPIVLIEGSPADGIYSGIGVNDGQFDPSLGPGLYEITYTYTDEITQCENSVTGQIEVFATQELIVESYTLINADTNEALFELAEGMRIDINTLPTLHLDVRANTTTAVESVRLSIEGALNNSRTESLLPYAFFRDLPIGDYIGADFQLGNYMVSAVPYSEDSLQGSAGDTFSLNFELFDSTLAITNFVLVNADTNEDLFLLEEGMVIDINNLPTSHLDIRANTTADVESVRLSLVGALTTARTESLVPYALYQDLPIGDYKGITFVLGNYTVSATPYSGDSLLGEMGNSSSLNFELIDSTLDSKSANAMVISPNPANNRANLSFKLPTLVRTITIYDAQGRLVRTYDGDSVKTLDTYSLEIKALQTGNYYITTIDKNGKSSYAQLIIKKE